MKLLDNLDYLISQEMQLDARQSSRQIANKLGVAHTTVQQRIKRMLKNDIIRIVALPNPKATGYELWVSILIIARHGSTRKVADELSKSQAFYFVTECLGHYDIMAAGHFKSIEELDDFLSTKLSAIQGIEDYQIQIFTKTHKYYVF